jgi:acyl-CoA synthetase (AMP-forming)/AMP-acid ligase II
MEAGFTKGDSLVMYCDQTSSAEALVAQMGSIKAGVQVVTFAEKDNIDALDHALRSTKAKGLLFQPDHQIDDKTDRASFVNKLMPELSKMYFGDELALAAYPNLEKIVQTKFANMRGVNMFKDLAVYANPVYSSRQIPTNDADATCFVALKDGKTTSYSSGEMVELSQNLWDSELNNSSVNDQPVFMSCDLETPLGFASFLACSTNFKKVFIPGTYNMSSLLKALPTQNSSYLVCDADFYNLEAPPSGNYKEMCADIKQVLVAGAKGKSDLFSGAKATAKDPYSMQ